MRKEKNIYANNDVDINIPTKKYDEMKIKLKEMNDFAVK